MTLGYHSADELTWEEQSRGECLSVARDPIAATISQRSISRGAEFAIRVNLQAILETILMGVVFIIF